MARSVLLLIVRLGIGGSFVLSGITKVFQMTDFIRVVERFDVLPAALVVPFSALFPPFELVLGLMLLFGYWTKWSSLGISFLLMTMLVAIFPQLLGGPQIGDCGCFGGLMDSAVDVNLFVRDLILFGLSYCLFVFPPQILSVDRYFQSQLQKGRLS